MMREGIPVESEIVKIVKWAAADLSRKYRIPFEEIVSLIGVQLKRIGELWEPSKGRYSTYLYAAGRNACLRHLNQKKAKREITASGRLTNQRIGDRFDGSPGIVGKLCNFMDSVPDHRGNDASSVVMDSLAYVSKLAKLKWRESDILFRRYASLESKMIIAREYGISKSRVDQIAARSLEKCKYAVLKHKLEV